jgi:hypothetical protein
MKLVADYLEQARYFERIAATESNEVVKQLLQEQAEVYHGLAKTRAMNLGQPLPERPPQNSN